MWPFNKKKEKEPQEAQEIVAMMTWRDNELQDSVLYASLFRVCSDLTRIWFSNGNVPLTTDEIVDTYRHMFKPLQTWFKGGDLKAQIKDMLETLYPEPPGYEPGETLLPKDDIIPGVKTVKYKPRESRE